MLLKSVCLIASKMEESNWRLQPWRYLTEVARQLAALGHPVSVLSDVEELSTTQVLRGQVKIHHISSVRNPVWNPNHKLLEVIRQVSPEVIIWHVGLTSFLYQSFPNNLNAPIVGLFSSPVYHARELARLGIRKLGRNYRYLRVHLLGSLIPDWFLRAYVPQKQFNSLVVQTRTTQRSIEQAGFWSKPIRVIQPGVDEIWSQYDHQNTAAVRSSLGFNSEDPIVLFYGSLVEPRGLNTLLKAVIRARRSQPDLKLVILGRRRLHEWTQEYHSLQRFLQDHHLEPHVKVISGFLEPSALINHVAAADIIALPFELLPSDAPLSVLEAQALGKPVITTRLACLPELVSDGEGYLAEPGDPNSLADAIELAVEKLCVEPDNKLFHPVKSPTRSWQEMGEEWSKFLQSL